MGSTFSGLNISLTGLTTSKTAIAVANNNVSNSTTTGYSRQTVTQTAIGPAATYEAGSGTEITAITRTRDSGLDTKYRQQNSTYGYWSTQSGVMSELEQIVSGLSGSDSTSDFSTVLSTFSSDLTNLSNNVGSSSNQSSLLEAANSICSYLNSMSTQLSDLKSDVNGQVKTTVDQINSYTSQIAALNNQISQAANSGISTNELQDSRDELVDKLSALANVSVTSRVVGQTSDGQDITMTDITSDNVPLVNGTKAATLVCTQGTDGMYAITDKTTGDSYTPSGGKLGALLTLRDGTGSNSINYYEDKLDEYARTFAKAMNEGILEGQTTSSYTGFYEGTGGSSGGYCLFTYDNQSTSEFKASTATDPYSSITAANISLASDVVNNVSAVAALSTSSSSGESGDNTNVNQLISICSSDKLFTYGTSSDYMAVVVAKVGNSSANATTMSTNTDAYLTYLNKQRTSVSSVDTTEEASNITMYQQAYTASAKMVSVWSDLYDATLAMVRSS